MNNLKSAALGLAIVALAAAGFTQSATAHMAKSASHQKMMDSCMAMSGDAMMADHGCIRMMKKMGVSHAHMKMMMSCKAMSKDDMMKNADCMKMSKMHPGMMKMDADKM